MDILRDNFIIDTDSYKASHWPQFPDGTNWVTAYLEGRGGPYNVQVPFGLQYQLKRYWQGQVVTHADVDEAARFIPAHGEPFNEEGWRYIVNEHGGRIPLKIRAVPEGTPVPIKSPILTIESTDPKTFWLSTYVETMIDRLWYTTGIATRTWAMKRAAIPLLKETCEKPEAVAPFLLLDFGSRGVTCKEQAMLGGMAYLVNFMGTDTMTGVRGANHYYGCASGMSGYSVPASEHSSTIAWGRQRESKMYARMLERFAVPGGIVSIVMDSYDQDNAVYNIMGDELKPMVEEKSKAGAKIVLRLDSGDVLVNPVRALRMLEERYGSYTNARGYKVLNFNLSILQGDGINEESFLKILERVVDAKFSLENIKLGSGGGILQKLDRDTQKVAFKASMIQLSDGVQEVCYPISKDPKTDPGKKSKEGYHFLIKEESGYKTVSTMNHPKHVQDVPGNILETVFENGEIKRFTTLDEVRTRADAA